MSENKTNAVNVANKDGLYENFTGVIEWGRTKGEVRNATFDLFTSNDGGAFFVTWHDGTWVNGILADATWWKGTWLNGTLIDSAWDRGEWMNGICKNVTWDYGIWHKGVFEDSIWHDGRWMNGLWKGDANKWYSGAWWLGTWQGGWWNLGTGKNGIIHYEGDSPDKWIKKKQTAVVATAGK